MVRSETFPVEAAMDSKVHLWWLMNLVLLMYPISLCLAHYLCSHSGLYIIYTLIFPLSFWLIHVSLLSSFVVLACSHIGESGVVGLVSDASCTGSYGMSVVVYVPCPFDVSSLILRCAFSLLWFYYHPSVPANREYGRYGRKHFRRKLQWPPWCVLSILCVLSLVHVLRIFDLYSPILAYLFSLLSFLLSQRAC